MAKDIIQTKPNRQKLFFLSLNIEYQRVLQNWAKVL